MVEKDQRSLRSPSLLRPPSSSRGVSRRCGDNGGNTITRKGRAASRRRSTPDKQGQTAKETRESPGREHDHSCTETTEEMGQQVQRLDQKHANGEVRSLTCRL
ncbi:hypothetical protein AOLI_G00173690 [Acnodon oligacanthus]